MKYLQTMAILMIFAFCASCAGGNDNSSEQSEGEASQTELKEVEALEELSNEIQQETEKLSQEAVELENDIDSLLK